MEFVYCTIYKFIFLLYHCALITISLGGPNPFIPDFNGDENTPFGGSASTIANNSGVGSARKRSPGDVSIERMRRARVLCSYDAKDHTELNLNSNEVIFVTECSPTNADYMYGKQGLLKGLVPRAFLEMLDDEYECAEGAGNTAY